MDSTDSKKVQRWVMSGDQNCKGILSHINEHPSIMPFEAYIMA